jgi:hypothetical protein
MKEFQTVMMFKTLFPPLLFAMFSGQVFANDLQIKTIARANALILQSTSQSGSGGNYTKILAPDLSALVHLNEKFALGFGLDFYYSKSNLDFWGQRIFSRRYFHGAGIQKSIQAENMDAKTIEKFAFYWGGEFKRYTYSLGSNKDLVQNYELVGNFYNVNGILGGDYRINNDFEINSEISYTAISLTATDNRIKATSLIIGLGISYLW